VKDPTEQSRRQRIREINCDPTPRESLEAKYGQAWDTKELCKDFDVEGFMAPYVVVRRKCDGHVGSMEFQHDPRFYFNFSPHREHEMENSR
jgi:hypothetical protein